ncbi:anaphase-promoting complex subunit 4-like protein [Dinothrombium tinctorium]|uniref:Anaphase-promoting complex subunit 4 n=1 Tax=Dinothrombium tinctorium TaxID=1965070 RepID=A0A3S3NXG4_9ACAR|nr:anaphase-promoting complex subunit 4-like protein [Dinothrombium tinctorium]
MLNFRQHDERHISSEVKLLKWNPKMDLIAIALKCGDVYVHRLMGWQRVCSLLCPLSESSSAQSSKAKQSSIHVTSLEWRPDGKVIAVGYNRNIHCLELDDSSCVALLDIDNGELINVIEIDSCIVTCLCWDSQLEELSDYDYTSFNQFLPKLKPLTKSYSNTSSLKLNEDTIDDIMKINSQKTLNILAVGTDKGQVLFYAFGVFRCGLITITGIPFVSYIALSKDLGLINVVCQNFASNEIKTKNYSVLSYSLDLFREKSRQYLTIARLYCKVISLLVYLDDTILAIQETWEDILLEIDSKLSNYVEKSNDKQSQNESTETTALLADEFLELLVFGTASESLDKFLKQLTDKGLKKLGHSIELTYSNIQKFVVINLQRVALHIYCHMNTLKSLSMWKCEFEELGLIEKCVNEALKSIGAFHLKCIELQQVIDTSIRNVKCFFRWLYVAMLRLHNESSMPLSQQELAKVSQQDVQFIAEFIKENFENKETKDDHRNRPTASNFTLERVGQYLKNEDLTCQNALMNNFSLNPWIQYIKDRPELRDMDNTFVLHPHNFEKSLIQEHYNLDKSVKTAFDGAFLSFCESIKEANSQLVDVMCLREDETPVFSHVTSKNQNCLYLALVMTAVPSNVVHILRYNLEKRNRDVIEISSASFFDESESDKQLKILDFQFYNDEVLSLLLCQNSTHIPYLLQLPIRFLNRSMRQISAYSVFNGNLESSESVAINLTQSNSLDICFRKLENMRALSLAVSGTRKVACILSTSSRRIRIFEMDVSEEEEVDDDEQQEIDRDLLADSTCLSNDDHD